MIEKTIKTATEYFQNFFSYDYHPKGFLQSVDTRVKLVGMIVLIVASVTTFNLGKILAILFSSLIISKLSNVSFRDLVSRVWLFTLFTFLIVLPLAFVEGFEYVLAFTLRVLTAIVLLQLIVLTTPFNELLYAMRSFKIPEVLVFSLGLTYRYIHLMFSELLRILIAMESRRIKKMRYREIWKEGGKILGSFFLRVYEKGENVQRAMSLRGDRIKFYSKPFKFGIEEALFTLLVVFVLVWWSSL